MGLENVNLAMILAQAQSLALMIEDVTTGECADCPCSVCVSMRGTAQMAAALRDS